jgi:transaldolase
MKETVRLGVEFWNDSCSPKELAEAIENGATGATSNPVIVYQIIKADPATWNPVIDALAREFNTSTDEEIAWRLIDEVAVRAAKQLEKAGFLSVQVNPKYYRDAARMTGHGKHLAALAPNIAIKAPCTTAGIEAMEALTAEGINVNATVSFSVAQALAAAGAIERGLGRAKAAGHDMSRMHPYVTIMVGRLDDHLQRVMTRDSVVADPGDLNWAGIAVFKKALGLFRQREFRSRLLVAAYRHHLHWSELAGEGIVQSIPYSWWKQFNGSAIEPMAKLRLELDPARIDRLLRQFPDFAAAYEENGLVPEKFLSFGPTIHTLNQFVSATQDLYALVRERMLAQGA